ncbi:hypothetical protein OU415_36000 [Saccharopolyspora sp. WRP15-2]|uniref:Uncharacterized protein n=1 Tax=Saccharopolyspora oryzae TaxID=2997343 RepID=A0ABT4VA76_9PSEU|nr:hypothetical protein [Saccharopolyspora oryzae]MDA3630875.1 hypothetical protein [Saccharopolyspora oryzae]
MTARRMYWEARVGWALKRYRRFLRRPGRWLYLPRADLYSPHDPADARDELELLLSELPPRTRAELRRILVPLDEEFRRRTFRDPVLERPAAWWRQRLRDGY